uniref:Uncharacterized protein n=1 Tax=Vitis vinifera TaxID=29760 RepID=F6HHV0_VITVI
MNTCINPKIYPNFIFTLGLKYCFS